MPEDLPDFVEPMLAKAGAPFDSDAHVFEIKWDGIRGLACVRADGRWSLQSRRRREMASRYPEFEGWGLAPGTLLDGEIVVLRDGLPNFSAVLRREQARGPMRVRRVMAEAPATFVAFDVLFDAFEDVRPEAWSARRERLERIVVSCAAPTLVLSASLPGAGRTVFRHACDRGLEGVVAKRVDSPYESGRRSGAWTKIKRSETVYCAVIGFLPDGAEDFKSLVVATDVDGTLRHVGQVGSGINGDDRGALNEWMRAHPRRTPFVPCAEKAVWIGPGLYCTVSYLERSGSGMLRAPVFRGLVEDG